MFFLTLICACGTDPVPQESPFEEPVEEPIPIEDPAVLLEQLGYVDGIADEQIETSGVVHHDKDKASEGLNFYTSRKQSSAQLLDMEGNLLHTWRGKKSTGWQHATLLPNGDVIIIIKGKQIFRIDQDSKVKWSLKGRFHHDLDILPDGTIYVLARNNVKRPAINPKGSVVQDYIQVIDPIGKPTKRISILNALMNSPYAFLVNRAEGLTARHYDKTATSTRAFDVLHANHIEVLDGSLAQVNPAFAKGNLLISTRTTHTPMILNPETNEIVWLWGTALLVYPHHPTITSDGTVLIFNNGTEQSRSQIVEVDPKSGNIVWTYGPVEHFFSATRGSNLRLPNGNTLITESDSGYVFEVTREGEVVWEFRNPHRQMKHGQNVRMAIWRMNRFTREELTFDFNGK